MEQSGGLQMDMRGVDGGKELRGIGEGSGKSVGSNFGEKREGEKGVRGGWGKGVEW